MTPATQTRAKAPPLMPPRAPRKVVGLSLAICREDFKTFARKKSDQHFCDERCRRQYHARIEARRTEAYNAGMAMRQKKTGGFSSLTNLFDKYIREDKRRETAIAEAEAQLGEA